MSTSHVSSSPEAADPDPSQDPAPNLIQTVAIGAFGGIFPTLLRLAMSTQQSTSNPLQNVDVAFFVGLSLFAVLGGAVASFWREKDRRKIFYVGICLPSLVTAVANGHSGSSANLLSPIEMPVLAMQTGRAAVPATARILRVTIPAEAAGVPEVGTFKLTSGQLVPV